MSDIVDRIFATFVRHGQESYGEDVTQLQHALQAAELARLDNASDALIAAALLHDIGQFVGGAGDAAEDHARDGQHEELGAALLAEHFRPDVTGAGPAACRGQALPRDHAGRVHRRTERRIAPELRVAGVA
ncbi:HD domain-containing protein [Sphingomonas sp. H160509]|uniref:HD domain-containing protein n=1 Tax=Sphingomonas sp. H160509 TaxID=2955313 RepID=UPI002097AB50|nr:HD domain-containing protein [Sphingomonas sp. H160509]MDD1449935.1 HD domain-containing protein [Sphingomonas sp. H160509]